MPPKKTPEKSKKRRKSESPPENTTPEETGAGGADPKKEDSKQPPSGEGSGVVAKTSAVPVEGLVPVEPTNLEAIARHHRLSRTNIIKNLTEAEIREISLRVFRKWVFWRKRENKQGLASKSLKVTLPPESGEQAVSAPPPEKENPQPLNLPKDPVIPETKRLKVALPPERKERAFVTSPTEKGKTQPSNLPKDLAIPEDQSSNLPKADPTVSDKSSSDSSVVLRDTTVSGKSSSSVTSRDTLTTDDTNSSVNLRDPLTDSSAVLRNRTISSLREISRDTSTTEDSNSSVFLTDPVVSEDDDSSVFERDPKCTISPDVQSIIQEEILKIENVKLEEEEEKLKSLTREEEIEKAKVDIAVLQKNIANNNNKQQPAGFPAEDSISLLRRLQVCLDDLARLQQPKSPELLAFSSHLQETESNLMRELGNEPKPSTSAIPDPGRDLASILAISGSPVLDPRKDGASTSPIVDPRKKEADKSKSATLHPQKDVKSPSSSPEDASLESMAEKQFIPLPRKDTDSSDTDKDEPME